MKSKQLNFFLLPDDFQHVESYLKDRSDVVFIAEPMYEKQLRIVSTLQQEDDMQIAMALGRKDHVQDVITRYVPKQHYYVIDSMRSEVIELVRCYYDGTILRRGRLYVECGYFDEQGQWVEKSHDFLKWVDGIFRWFRKAYKRNQLEYYREFHTSPAVVEWVQQGGKISQV